MAAFVKNPQLSRKLAHLGIYTVEDLLYYFPYRFDDFSRIAVIRNLCGGQTFAVEGVVCGIKVVQAWKTRMQLIEAIVEDASGRIRAVWFNQLYLLKTLKKGTPIALAGRVYESKRGIYFANPAFELLPAPTNNPLDSTRNEHQSTVNHGKSPLHTRRLVPVYRETKGVTSRWIRTLVHQWLPTAKHLPDALPENIRVREKFLPLAQAFVAIHFPQDQAQASEARRRFQCEELLLYQLRFARDRKNRETVSAHSIPFNQKLVKSFVDALPFKLTDGQRKAAWHILQDIAKTHPMQRLLEGDVGSGKTIVAFLAILETVKAGFQAILMAPTEVLARQHFANAKKILASHHITVGFATSTAYALTILQAGEVREKKVAKKTFYALLKTGEIQFATGTHALISGSAACKDLALAIVDEQHRFGVEQRARLLKKTGDAFVPHFLSMSATPIPRTLALAVYGDLDISRITETPANRQPIETRVIPPHRRNEAYAFIRKEVQRGGQVFVICPRIESALNANNQQPTTNHQRWGVGSGKLAVRSAWDDVKTVKEEYEKLSKTVFPDLRVSMLHGKMKPKEKEMIMKNFTEHASDILVSTSVIEVGIDVPNATIIAIEGADRFGLAQLHQFRGRVGRGERQSYCLVLSDSAGAETHARLKALINAKNGFALAQIDLELRGPGQFMGLDQAGLPDFAMEALRHPQLIESAREDAKRILTEDPDLTAYPDLKNKLQKAGERVHPE